MKRKMNVTMFGLFLIFFGYIDMTLSIEVYASSGRFYNQTPMNTIYGIVVDSKGNIFFALSANSIQVFDNTGAFLYGFAYATPWGNSTFAIDSNDVVHIAVAGEGIQSFYNGYLIKQRAFMHADEFTEIRNSRKQRYVDIDGNIYIIRDRVFSMEVQIYDKYGDFVRNISRANITAGSPAVARINYAIQIFLGSARPIILFLGVTMFFIHSIKLLLKIKKS